MTHETDTIQTTAVMDDPQARALLQATSDRGYRLPADFPGFTAQLTVQIDADTWSGRVAGRTPQEITVTLDAAAADTARDWAQNELRSIIGHRWPTPFSQRDGRYTLTCDATPHPLGTRIHLHGNPMHSAYRVREDHIRLVQRTAGAQSFTITLLAHTHVPDGRSLPAQYVVVFRDGDSNDIVRVDAYTDTFVEIGDCWLPAWRQVVSHNRAGMRASTLTLHDHRLFNQREW